MGQHLEVMGISVEHGEYAIVGGTVQFSMARGVIYKKFHEQRSDGNIIKTHHPWILSGVEMVTIGGKM